MSSLQQEDTSSQQNKRKLERELDRLEAKINELRILYEQYFVDILPRAPEKLHKEVKTEIRRLLRAPFKNSQTRFRLRQLVNRFQTYSTYWERVNKQREEGTYQRDVNRAEMRERMLEEEARMQSRAGIAEAGMKQLFSSYQLALKKSGVQADKVNFDGFKKQLVKQAAALRKQHGSTKLQYRVVKREGKVVIKASAVKPKD